MQTEITPAEQCSAVVDNTARLLDEPPPDLDAEVARLRQNDSFERQLKTGPYRKLAWFREVGGSVTLCSYKPSRDECQRDIVAINFRRGATGWYPIEPFAGGGVCIRTIRHGGRIILPAKARP